MGKRVVGRGVWDPLSKRESQDPLSLPPPLLAIAENPEGGGEWGGGRLRLPPLEFSPEIFHEPPFASAPRKSDSSLSSQCRVWHNAHIWLLEPPPPPTKPKQTVLKCRRTRKRPRPLLWAQKGDRNGGWIWLQETHRYTAAAFTTKIDGIGFHPKKYGWLGYEM